MKWLLPSCLASKGCSLKRRKVQNIHTIAVENIHNDSQEDPSSFRPSMTCLMKCSSLIKNGPVIWFSQFLHFWFLTIFFDIPILCKVTSQHRCRTLVLHFADNYYYFILFYFDEMSGKCLKFLESVLNVWKLSKMSGKCLICL